jgi:hypothetical protein
MTNTYTASGAPAEGPANYYLERATGSGGIRFVDDVGFDAARGAGKSDAVIGDQTPWPLRKISENRFRMI